MNHRLFLDFTKASTCTEILNGHLKTIFIYDFSLVNNIVKTASYRQNKTWIIKKIIT